jgi:hypothetical protein
VAGLTNATLSLGTGVSSGSPAVHVAISSADRCATLADDVVATFDGHPMTLTVNGGTVDTFEGPDCQAIELVLATAPALPGQVSTFTLADATATWTVSGKDLLTNDLVTTSALAPGGHATVAWTSATQIAAAYVEFDNQYQDVQFAAQLPDLSTEPAGSITDNVIHFDIPPGVSGYGTLHLDANRTPAAVACDGPATCALSVSAAADFTATIR